MRPPFFDRIFRWFPFLPPFIAVGCLQTTAEPDFAGRQEKAGPTRVVCVGDSITYGHGIEKREKLSYPAQLGALLGPGYRVKNCGVSGATLLRQGDKPYFAQRPFSEAMEFQPGIVVIKLGTNDTKPQNWAYAGAFVEDYRRLIRDFKALPSRPKVYVCLPAPVYQDRFGIRASILNNGVIPAIKKVARQENVEVIDLHTALKGKPEMFPDSIHPNSQGTQLMAEMVANRLKNK